MKTYESKYSGLTERLVKKLDSKLTTKLLALSYFRQQEGQILFVQLNFSLREKEPKLLEKFQGK